MVIIEFWAGWCRPCVQELPALKALYEKHRDQGLSIVGLSFDESEEMLRKSMMNYAIPWLQVLVGDQTQWQAMAQQTGATSIPRYFVIDREEVLQTDDGRGKLETLIPELLGE